MLIEVVAILSLRPGYTDILMKLLRLQALSWQIYLLNLFKVFRKTSSWRKSLHLNI